MLESAAVKITAEQEATTRVDAEDPRYVAHCELEPVGSRRQRPGLDDFDGLDDSQPVN
jgi:hypothetical protein